MALRCCSWAFSSCGEPGSTLQLRGTGFSLRWCLLLRSPGSAACGLQQFQFPGSRAQARQSWWMDFVAPLHVGSSRTRERTWSPASVGRFFTTEPPGKPQSTHLMPRLSLIQLEISVQSLHSDYLVSSSTEASYFLAVPFGARDLPFLCCGFLKCQLGIVILSHGQCGED